MTIDKRNISSCFKNVAVNGFDKILIKWNENLEDLPTRTLDLNLFAEAFVRKTRKGKQYSGSSCSSTKTAPVICHCKIWRWSEPWRLPRQSFHPVCDPIGVVGGAGEGPYYGNVIYIFRFKIVNKVCILRVWTNSHKQSCF